MSNFSGSDFLLLRIEDYWIDANDSCSDLGNFLIFQWNCVLPVSEYWLNEYDIVQGGLVMV